MCVPKAILNKLFEYGILRFIGRMKVNSAPAFVLGERLLQIGWSIFGLHAWFFCSYNIRKLFRVAGPVLMI